MELLRGIAAILVLLFLSGCGSTDFNPGPPPTQTAWVTAGEKRRLVVSNPSQWEYWMTITVKRADRSEGRQFFVAAEGVFQAGEFQPGDQLILEAKGFRTELTAPP